MTNGRRPLHRRGSSATALHGGRAEEITFVTCCGVWAAAARRLLREAGDLSSSITDTPAPHRPGHGHPDQSSASELHPFQTWKTVSLSRVPDAPKAGDVCSSNLRRSAQSVAGREGDPPRSSVDVLPAGVVRRSCPRPLVAIRRRLLRTIAPAPLKPGRRAFRDPAGPPVHYREAVTRGEARFPARQYPAAPPSARARYPGPVRLHASAEIRIHRLAGRSMAGWPPIRAALDAWTTSPRPSIARRSPPTPTSSYEG